MIAPRRRIFIACEGESERSYVKLLQLEADKVGKAVHLDTHVCGGGDPLAIVEQAVRIGRSRARQHCLFDLKVIILDSDRCSNSQEVKIKALAHAERFTVCWQRPCHEAMLLRHIAGCETQRPLTSEIAKATLKRKWPDYEKAQSARSLSGRIGYAELARAASVEPELRHLLEELGLLGL